MGRRRIDPAPSYRFLGASACRTGSRRQDCPYPPHHDEARWWREGFDAEAQRGLDAGPQVPDTVAVEG